MHFALIKTHIKFIPTENRDLNSLVGPSETSKSQLQYNWLQNGNLWTKFDKKLIFYRHSQPLYSFTQTKIEIFEFGQAVNIEFEDS